MSISTVLAYSFGYLALLFAIAYFAERRSAKGKSVVSPSMYALSLAVYCSAWTYYGSVGRAVKFGIDYLLIYLGPTLMTPLWWMVLRKIIRICKVQRITSIADFISARYGKSATLGMVVAFFCIIGVVPYIALQIKAISLSLDVLVNNDYAASDVGSNGIFFSDITFYITIGLAIFTILFGVRKMDVTERHEGIVAAIAFESLWKLVVFLLIGFVITYSFFDGFTDIFQQAQQIETLAKRFTLQSDSDNWFWMMFISMNAVLLLPRQFQVGVVENTNERHILRATWLFPLYLLVINIFVLPIAFGGELSLLGTNANPDMFVLSLPLSKGYDGLAILVYLGGLSAATSMIIVSSIALSVMASNNLIVPALLRLKVFSHTSSSFNAVLKYSRWGSIILILLASYGYCVSIASDFTLVSIGLISFSAVAQFAPAVIGGLFWKEANRKGALWGIVGGFIIWFYTLVLPSIIEAGLLPFSILEQGLFGWFWLKPFALFGLEGMGYIAHALFWSMLVNLLIFISCSTLLKAGKRERQQAKTFVDIFKLSEYYEEAIIWKSNAYFPDIQALLINLLGVEKTEHALQVFRERHAFPEQQELLADAKLIAYAENLLSGIVGAAAARIVVASVAKEEQIEIDKVVNILKESQEVRALNKQLKQTSDELQLVTQQLQQANTSLTRQDEIRNEFLYTVTHELRTPLTSIRAMSEILQDHREDMSQEEQEEFLTTIVKESERLTRLITQVLDLEKFDSGKQRLDLELCHYSLLIEEAVSAYQTKLSEKQISLHLTVDDELMIELDKDRITQVLINLISNAIKFCSEAGQIHLQVHQLNDVVETTIQDNGCGISAEALPHIFDKFYQVKQRAPKNIKGTGLGLPITKKIIQLHGGMIKAESTLGIGTKITFSLPISAKQVANTDT